VHQGIYGSLKLGPWHPSSDMAVVGTVLVRWHHHW